MEPVFIQTSAGTYDRHTYQVILKEGKAVPFEYYEDAMNYWFQKVQLGNLVTIEVLDRPKKRTKARGF